MCKHKRKKKWSDSTQTLPVKTAHSSTTKTNTVEAGAHQNKVCAEAKGKRPKVGDVHKTIMTIEENHHDNAETKKRQMEEAMKLLGCSTVNTTIIQRIEKANHNKDMPEKSQVSTRQGDIAFTLSSKSLALKKPMKDDDTLYPLHGNKAECEENIIDQEVELLQEDDTNEPNSENYMWNTREIRYCCVSMIRHLDKNVIIEATGHGLSAELGEEEKEQKIDWDPYAPMDVMENRSIFTCHLLRKNTFLSTVLCCSNTDEQKAAKTKSKASLPKKVKVLDPPKKLTRLKPEYPVKSNVPSRSNSLDITPPTQEKTVEGKSKMVNKK